MMANSQRENLPQDSAAAVLGPALKVGAFTGTTGFLLGGTAGILKSTTPTLFATATGIQTFCLGAGYWATRGVILSAWQPGRQGDSSAGNRIASKDVQTASALAGASTGGLAGLIFRGRTNVLPGLVMFGAFGWTGQVAYDRYDQAEVVEGTEAAKGSGFWRWLADRKWSPVTVMSDEEYAELLQKKMLNVEVELAVVEDKIEAFRKQEREAEDRNPPAPESRS